MARPNNDVTVNRYFFEIHAWKVKEAIGQIVKKESLNDGDIQAIKILIEVYEALLNQSKGNGAQHQAKCSSAYDPASQEK